MAEKIMTMEVVTPEHHICSLETEAVVVPAFEGYLGVLPNHAPLITQLGLGVVTYKVGGKEKKIAEMAEEIDVERAYAARERAESRLKDRTDSLDYIRAQAALQRATTRLKAAGKEQESKYN